MLPLRESTAHRTSPAKADSGKTEGSRKGGWQPSRMTAAASHPLNNTHKEGDMTMFLLFLATLVVNLFSNAWYAFVTSKLYAWFIVPLGAPLLNWWHIWGLLLVIELTVMPYTYKHTDDSDSKMAVKFWTKVITTSIATAIILLIGYIAKGQIS